MFSDKHKSKKCERRVSREKERKKEGEKEKENGQFLLFDGQSIDDKDYAIILSIELLI